MKSPNNVPYGHCFHAVYCHLQPRAKLCLNHSRDCMYAQGKVSRAKEQVKNTSAKCIQSSSPSPDTHCYANPTRTLTEVPRTTRLNRALLSSPKYPNSDAPSYQQTQFLFFYVHSSHFLQKFNPAWVYKHHSIRRGRSQIMTVVSFWSK